MKYSFGHRFGLILGTAMLAAAPALFGAQPSAAEMRGIREAYVAARHAIAPVDGGWQALNPGQQWTTKFDGRGFETSPKSGGWKWGLELKKFGLAGRENELGGTPAVQAAGGTLVYEWGALLHEWFVNDARGLEHGYTVSARPEGDASAPLSFTMGVRGGLAAAVSGDEKAVAFRDGAGATAVTYSGLKVWDAEGRELVSRFESAGDDLRLLVDDKGARYPLIIDPLAQQAYVTAQNADANDIFGCSVAISGDTAVVGAYREDGSSSGVNGPDDDLLTDSGAAYVFVRNGFSWTQQAYLKASNPGLNDQFGYRVAISGNTIVVAALLEDGGGAGVNPPSDDASGATGAVYVFVRNGGTWTQQAYIKASNPEWGDVFGSSVALDGDLLVVGAPSEDGSVGGVNPPVDNLASASGAVYVFGRAAGTWAQEAYLKAPDPDSDDYFGGSVAVSGNTVVVGAFGEAGSGTGVNPADNDLAPFAGAAFVFVKNGPTWSQQAYLKASNTQAQDYFGWSVGISGETIIVSAPYEDGSGSGVNPASNDSLSDAGAAYVYTRSGVIWSQQAYLKASNPGQDDYFGWAVAISGDVSAVGAMWESTSGTGTNPPVDELAPYSGATYVYSRSGATWSQTAFLKASNPDEGDVFGSDVAISSGTILIGAPYAPFGGAAYIFDTPPNPVAEISVQQGGSPVETGGSRGFGGVVENTTVDMTFTITNQGGTSLVFGGTPKVAVGGFHPSLFTVTTPPASPVLPYQSTTFTVRFAPTNSGIKSATLTIPNNDPNESPFQIDIGGIGVNFTTDFDNDGLNDGSEVQMAAFGFDWQVAQPALVNTYYSSANGAGLYSQSQLNDSRAQGRTDVTSDPNAYGLYSAAQFTANRTAGQTDVTSAPNTFNLYTAAQFTANRTAGQTDVTSDPNAFSLYTLSQVQALNVGGPLLQRNPTTGTFTLTIGVEKSTNLTTFSPFPMTAPQLSVDAQGRLRFEFTSPGNAAFFRVRAQ